jgi:hypothetical protein
MMKKFLILGGLILLNQFAIAADTQQTTKAEGCLYGDVVYKRGDKHRVLIDPASHKANMQDAKIEIWQECKENLDADSSKLPRFYWETLPNYKETSKQ